MPLPPRAAAIRGDNYQHTVGWFWACQMLRDPDIETVAIEDPASGHFDDVVVRRRRAANTYVQVKSSNYGNTIIDTAWLTTPASEKGRSPLQHFHDTYLDLASAGPFDLEVWTNRGFDHDNPLLGKLLDQKTDKVDVDLMVSAGKKSKIGIERDFWALHLGITVDELASFLSSVSWKQTGSELEWRHHCKPLMELAGLRSDDEAVTLGVDIASGWVTNGAGPRTADDVRAEAAARNLLALEGELLLLVNGIDQEHAATPPNFVLDFVDLYEGESSFARKVLKDPGDWDGVIRPAIEEAARTLASYRVRKVHVSGAMRHPMWFAVGRAFPQVKKWILSMDQVAAVWATDASVEEAAPRMLASLDLEQGTDVAVAIGLTGEPTADVEKYLRVAGAPVGKLLVLGPQADPSPTAVPSDGWAMGWTRAARELVRQEVQTADATGVHVFLQCPAGVALMLGHQWNIMPTTTVYEYVAGTYISVASFDGT
jgi:hypothetical protein